MRRAWVKCVCAVLCVFSLAAGVCGGLIALNLYISYDHNFYDSSICYQLMSLDRWQVIEYTEILQNESQSEEMYSNYLMSLSAVNSNFRYRCVSSDGTVVLTNIPEEEASIVLEHSWPFEVSHWDDNENWTGSERYTLQYGVADPMVVQDGYMSARIRYNTMHAAAPSLAGVSGGCLLLGLALLIGLLCTAGRRHNRPGVVLNLQDHIPYDLYLAGAVVLGVACIEMGSNGWYFYYQYGNFGELIELGLCALCAAAVAVALLLTTATRLKTHTLLRSTAIWYICKGARAAFQTMPMVWRAVVLFLLYLIGTVLSGVTIVLIPVYQGLVLWLLCRWVLQWRQIREATGAIVSGCPDVKIDHSRFYPDLYQHAAQLNDLGSAIDCAVEDRLKSERFKTELITNVSHDLKTPLTSIINYVDLLKKENIDNPRVREYLDVLDRKSQRLKKLTEDLVEASKASSGALTVERTLLDVAQLVEQAAGEYKEKLAAGQLTLLTALPGEAVWINADGRHVWRVLDNLLGNCVKYALEGTRVYVDVTAWDGNAVILVKNISRQQLNIPPEQLMERFVRGDESRTTEGSGLGLSIARSLTELQGGQFSLSIDGDLFKAAIYFPLAQPPAEQGLK